MKIKDFKDDVYVPKLWIELVKTGFIPEDADEVCLAYVDRFRDEDKPVITIKDLSEIMRNAADQIEYEWAPEFDDDEEDTPQTH